MSDASTDAWLKSGEYLPEFMRDFHDQKDLFKALQEVVDRRNEADGQLSYTAEISWVSAHVYTVDVFLWCLARRGYTLQRSRKRVLFDDIHEFIGEAKKRWRDASARALGLVFAGTNQSRSDDAAKVDREGSREAINPSSHSLHGIKKEEGE